MASLDRGTKRQCLHCSTKFYDLNRDPILCPSCGKQFLLEAAPLAAVVEEKKETVEVEKDTAAEAVGAEVISLDDAEDDDDDDDDDIPDVEDVEVDDELSSEDDDVFLEDDDDDDDIGIEVAKDDDDS